MPENADQTKREPEDVLRGLLQQLADKCPKCPDCGGDPLYIFPYQALCRTEDCHVWMWDPTQTARANLEDAGIVQSTHGVKVTGQYEEHPGSPFNCQHEPCKSRASLDDDEFNEKACFDHEVIGCPECMHLDTVEHQPSN